MAFLVNKSAIILLLILEVIPREILVEGANLERSVSSINSADSNDNKSTPTKIRIILTKVITRKLDSSELNKPDVSYFGPIGLGNPVKLFNVAFDSSSSEFWLPQYNWLAQPNNLHHTDGYSCRESTTCRPGAQGEQYTLDYRKTKLSGENYTDLVTIYQDLEGVSTTWAEDDALIDTLRCLTFEQNFFAIAKANDEQFKRKPYDGIVGLAPINDQYRGSGGTRNILLSIQQGRPSTSYISPTDSNLMILSFWFNQIQNSTYGGELMVGGIDETRYENDIEYYKINSELKWQLPITYLMLGGQVVSCSSGCNVILDTNTNSLIGPRQDVDRILEEIKATKIEDNLWLVDCDKQDTYPNLIIQIHSTPYIVRPNNYIRMFGNKPESKSCYLALESHDSPDWILGTIFMESYYTVLDFSTNRIGFAAPRSN